MKFERVYAKIDLDAIEHNFSLIKNAVSDDTVIMPVIKANAYGHGAVQIAELLSDIAGFFGVATVGEAVELRAAGIANPILLLGHTHPKEYITVLENDITVTVFTIEDAEKLNITAKKLGKIAKVHIAVDTGMNRIGFQANEAEAKLASRIFSLENIEVEGLFSHFATADMTDTSFAYKQKEEFDKFAKMLEEYGCRVKLRHLDNSAGIMEIDGSSYDMVRAGIMLYGLYPSDEVNKKHFPLRPAMELITHISHIKTLPAGCGISYGHTYVTDRETVVATIPVGYADGYPRALSGVGRVLIDGASCPVLGRICMDQMMVDVTDITDVKVSDEVVLVGKCGDDVITVEELAAPASSFNYEFVCNIGRRVPRAYFKNGKHVKTVSYL